MVVTVPAAVAALATLSLASSLWQSQHMFHTSLGRNIRHLPCISRRTGEAGTCMFAFSCAKANGTHLGTCIDRFYFGSCCKMPGAEEGSPSELDLAPPIEDNSLDGGTTTTNRIRPAITQGSFPVSPVNGMVATSKHPPSISTTSSLPPYSSSISLSSTPSTTLAPTQRPASVSTTAPWSRPASTPGHWTQWLNNTTSVRPPTPSSPSSVRPPLPAVSSTGGLLSTTSSVLAASSSSSAPKEPTTIPPTLVTWTTLEEATGKPPPVSLRPQVSSSSFGTHLPLVSVTTTEATSTTSRRPLPNSTGVPVTAKPVTTTSRPRPPVTSPKPKPPSSVGTSRPPTPSPVKPKPSVKPPTKPPTSPPPRPGLVTKPTTVGASSPTTTRPTTPRPTSTRPTSETWVPVNLTTHAPSPTTPFPTTTKKPTTKRPVSSTSQLSTSSTPSQSTGSPSSTQGSTWSTAGVSSTRPPPSSGVSTTRPPPTVGVSSTPFPSTGGISSTRPPPTVGVSSTPFPSTSGISSIRPPPSVGVSSTPFQPTGGISSTQPPSTGGVGSTRPPSTDSGSSTRPPPTGGSSSTQPPSTGGISSTTSPATGGISSTVTISTTVPVTLEPPLGEALVNMTNYKDVCGRRLFPESRVVGGDQSSFGKWPWQISLRQWRTSTYLHKCGAALLNENWAITAAHCVENVPPSDLLLRLGEHDLSIEDEPYGYQERRVQIVASHPQFDPRTFEYDLALLRFYEPVNFQPNIIPICVPEDDTNFVGTTAFVTGWGRLYEDGPLPSILQEVSVPVINNTLCETMYKAAGYIEHIPDIFICAGWKKGGFDSCEGDSGGPMVIQRPDKRWLLAGVISWGIGCAEPNQPGVYTRISQFRHWINQILQF